jgi:hypothetical protein
MRSRRPRRLPRAGGFSLHSRLSLALALGVLVAGVATSVPTTTWSASDVAVAPSSGPNAHPADETSVAIDPTNTDRVIAVAISHGHDPNFVCCSRGVWHDTAYASQDGGTSWTVVGDMVPVGNDGQPMTCDDPTTWDPWVTFDRHGRGYLSYMSSGAGIPTVADPCVDATFAVVTSDDGGFTWGAPTLLAGDPACFPDRDSMAAAPHEDAVYVAWSDFCETGPIKLRATTDGGATWSAPVDVSLATDGDPYGASVRVGPDGTVYVAYYRSAPFDGCIYVIGTGVQGIASSEAVVAVSHDHGATWEHRLAGPICDAEYQTPLQPLQGGGSDFSWPMLAVDTVSGRLALAWENRDVATPNIHVTVSDDGGATWSTPSIVGDAGRGSFMPAIAIADGILRLSYTSFNTQGEYDVRYRESADGATWSDPFTLSTGYACQCWGPLTSTYIHGQGMGHYHGMAAQGGKIVATWADNRDVTGYQTIYARVGEVG